MSSSPTTSCSRRTRTFRNTRHVLTGKDNRCFILNAWLNNRKRQQVLLRRKRDLALVMQYHLHQRWRYILLLIYIGNVKIRSYFTRLCRELLGLPHAQQTYFMWLQNYLTHTQLLPYYVEKGTPRFPAASGVWDVLYSRQPRHVVSLCVIEEEEQC